MRNLWLLFVVGLATGFISEKLFVSSQTHLTTADDMYLEGRTSGDLPIDDEDGDDDGSGSGSGDYVFRDFTEAEEILQRFLNISQTNITKVMVPAPPQPTAGSPHNPSTTAAHSQAPSTTAAHSQAPSTTAAHSQGPSTTVKHTETTPVILPAGDKKDKETTGPTADWSTQSTRPSSTSKTASETTATTSGIDITVIKEADEDNSLDKWDVTTPKKHEDEVLVKEVENDLMVKNGKGSRIYEMNTPEEVTSENMWERTEVLAAVIACGVVGFLCAVFLLILLAYRMKKKDEGSYDLGDTKVSTTAYHKAPTKEFYA